MGCSAWDTVIEGQRRPRLGAPALVVVALVFAAACAPSTRNQSHEILLQNSEEGRQANFTRFMTDQNCGAVTRTFFQGLHEPDGTAFWNITCSNGTSYVVAIAADDTTRILDCRRYEADGLQRCFETFAERVAELTRPKPSPIPGKLPPEKLRN
jgi:hypothetical protein